MSLIPVFDGHNDTLRDLPRTGRSFFSRGAQGHVDLPRAREGGLAGGFCACFVTTAEGREAEVPQGEALALTIAMMANLFRLERESHGQVRVVRTAVDIDRCLEEGVFAALLHIEGAESIDPEFHALEVFYGAGLRSLGLVWSRSNIYGHGVPFRFPSSPDTGPGLTEAGKNLVRACNRLGIVVDLAHLNEQGFWDVAAISDKPLIATHSNAHSITATTRNLTDTQLDAIKDSDGMVGVNFATGFVRPDGRMEADTPLEMLADHFAYLAERLGIDRVGFGSDFDGATIPQAMGDCAGLQRMIDALRARGFDEPSLRKVAYENWLRVLRATWGA